MGKSHLQVFIENLTQSILSILKIALLSKFRISLPKAQQTDCVILGNGPSLNEFIENHFGFLKNKSTIAVNNFSRTKIYSSIKPDYYVITSPEHFITDQKKGWHKDRLITFQSMADRTSWKMTLFVPVLAKKHQDWSKIIELNKNIEVCYFNNTPIEGFRMFKHFSFSKNLGMPRPHNVLIPSLLIGINLRFQNIYIAGADHSWTKELFVTEDNKVLLSQKHFYDKETVGDETDKNKPTPKPMYVGASIETRKLHEVLIKFYYSFRSYWDLKYYAEDTGTTIVNITPKSFIDAFERLKM